MSVTPDIPPSVGCSCKNERVAVGQSLSQLLQAGGSRVFKYDLKAAALPGKDDCPISVGKIGEDMLHGNTFETQRQAFSKSFLPI